MPWSSSSCHRLPSSRCLLCAEQPTMASKLAVCAGSGWPSGVWGWGAPLISAAKGIRSDKRQALERVGHGTGQCDRYKAGGSATPQKCDNTPASRCCITGSDQLVARVSSIQREIALTIARSTAAENHARHWQALCCLHSSCWQPFQPMGASVNCTRYPQFTGGCRGHPWDRCCLP